MTFTKACSVLGLGVLALVTLGTTPPQDDRVPAALPYEGKHTITGTIPLVDVSCILRSWRLKGVMVCVSASGVVRTCLWVENAWPSGILEVVRQPLRTHYAELKGALAGLEPLRLFGKSSSHTALAADGTANEFAEARVYTFVPDFGLSQSEIPLAIPSGSQFSVNYVSELDGYGWRSPAIDNLTAPETLVGRFKSCSIPDPFLCAGTWGSYFPRIGFVNHPSEVIAAYLQALRAGRVASRPLGRLALEPYSFEPRTGHYIQMLSPSYRTCVSIGSPLVRAIETGARSKWGAYLFIHFGVFEVCKGCLPVRLTGERAPQ